MNEKILIINVHSSRNLGDAALLNVALQQLYASFPTSQVTICMDDPESHHGKEKVFNSVVSWAHPKQPDGTVRWNSVRLLGLIPASLIPILTYRIFAKPVYLFTPSTLKPTVEAYLQADLVISGPGGFLYSSGRGISLLITVFSIFIALWAGKPLYLLPQSIGPLKHGWEKTIVRGLLNRIRIVMVREPISSRLVNEIGVRQDHVKLIPDLAFAMAKADKQPGETWLANMGISPQNDVPILGMTIINWGEQHAGFDHQPEYEEACARAVKWFIESVSGRVILFPQVFGPYASQDDRVPARRVVKRISELADSILIVEEPVQLDLLKSIYGRMDIFIGTRMHSNIFALTEDVPVVMIGYLPKTRGMAEMLGIDEWCLDISEVTGDHLVERLKLLWESHQYWNETSKRKFEDRIKDTTEVGEMVRKDYLNWYRENH